MDTIPTPKNKPVRKIAVLLWNQRYSEHPRAFVEDFILTHWLECGWAKRIGRNKFQINRPDRLKLHDVSAVHPGALALEPSLRRAYLELVHV